MKTAISVLVIICICLGGLTYRVYRQAEENVAIPDAISICSNEIMKNTKFPPSYNLVEAFASADPRNIHAFILVEYDAQLK